MARVTATDQLQRILAILPWIVQHQGVIGRRAGRAVRPESGRAADRSRLRLLNVGLHPFTPDMLADVTIEDDRVYVHLGDYFRRPLRLTHAEALTLLAGGRALSDRPGSDPDGTLARAVAKLAAALGDGAETCGRGGALGAADPEVLAAVQRRRSSSTSAWSIDYYSYGRDEPSVREVDPYRVLSNDGHWYLLGWCHTANGERLFRIDRIQSATALDTTFDPPEGAGDGELDLSASPRTVELVGPRSIRWVSDTYPCDEAEDLDDDTTRVVLPVTATPWLERLLLRLDPRTVRHGPGHR